LALLASEQSTLASRGFGGEMMVVREVLRTCCGLTMDLIALGQPARLEFDTMPDSSSRRHLALEAHLGKILDQPSPLDSLSRLLELIGDLEALIDAADPVKRNSYSFYLRTGRVFRRGVESCRFIDMVLRQRFRPTLDRVENTALSEVVRNIRDATLRRSFSLVLLHVLRMIRYLDVVQAELKADHPLRRSLAVFALLHEECGKLERLMKSGLSRALAATPRLRSAVDLCVYALRADAERVTAHELPNLGVGRGIPEVRTRIENAHGILQNCCQGLVVSLVRAFDRSLESRSVFPAMVDSQERSQRLKQALWNLRGVVREALENRSGFDLTRVLDAVARFRETSLRDLMYRDWEAFERFSDGLLGHADPVVMREELRRFAEYLERLIAEVSKRQVLRQQDSEARQTAPDWVQFS
jgi:hypothetical protein